MQTLRQPAFNMPVNDRTVLIPTTALRIALGVDADTIFAKVDAGEFQWVWDVSTKPGTIRDLRFWVKEVIAPEFTRMRPEQAIGELMGSNRVMWTGTQMGHLLLVSRPTIAALHANGELPGEIVSGTFHLRGAWSNAFSAAV